jgi:hypothetical protein
MATKNLLVRGGADFSALKKAMGKVQKDLANFKDRVNNSLKGVGVALAAVGAGITLGSGIKDAMKFEALMGTIKQTMGASAKDFENWQNTVGASLGFSKLQAAELGNTLSLRLKDVAADQQDLFNKTTQLMKAAAIIRSKTGMEMTEVSDRIRSAMNREADGADELGVNVRVAALEQSKAYKEMANGQPFDKLSQSMQKTITYYSILEQVSGNLGDTIAYNTALKMSVFQGSLLNLRLAMGQAWLPILNIALPALTKLTNALTRAFTVFAQFMSALFGYKADAGGLGAQSDAADSLANSVDGVGNAYQEAGKAAKKAQGSLAGFDEINTLADTASAAGEGETGEKTGPGSGGVKNPLADVDPTGGVVGKLGEIEQKIQEFATKVKAWLSPLKEPWEKLKTAIKGVGTSISELWNSEAVTKLRGWLASSVRFLVQKSIELLTEAFNTLSGAIDTINGVINGDHKKIMEGLKKVFDSNEKSIQLLKAGVIGLTAAMVAQTIINALTSLYKAWKTATTSMTTAQWLLNVAMNANPLGLIAAGIGLAVAAGILLYQNWDTIKEKAGQLWEGIKAAFGKLGEWFGTNVKEPLTKVWTEIKTNISTMASEAWGAVKTTFNAVKTWFETTVKTPLATVWTDIKTTISTKASEAWEEVKSKFSSVKTWFENSVRTPIVAVWNSIKADITKKIEESIENLKTTFTGLMTFIKGVFTGDWEKAWEGVKGIFKGVFDNLYDIVKRPLNLIIDAINAVIGGLNSISVKVPDWVPEFGGKTFGINIPKIPHLAKGGITNGPMMAVIGDNPGGREVVSPLDDLQDIIASAVGTAVSQAMQMGGSKNSGPVNLIIDGTTIARAIGPYLNKENNRIGGSMIRTI